eukprot:TRINITY_DN73069_c0_g1_i1.p1 TRINITY_DN73069_c0_g1~~TRINITY_DN73069_c0_g1_i1.p1  ORF type:complete len:309 (-),score=42.27 TRINITY_DN73069_c0_g1_i1:7-933(-)
MNNANSNVYIAGLPRDVNEMALRQLFMPYGDIVSVRIMPGRQAQQSNFAFVKYNLESEAQAAIDNVNGQATHDGSRLIVRMADKELQQGGAPRDTHSQTNIHISGLPLEMDEETFRSLFVEFGPIKSVKMANEPRIKKKYGFINFFDSLCAANALKRMHKKMYNGHELYVKYAVFTEKSPPPPNLQMQHFASLSYPVSPTVPTIASAAAPRTTKWNPDIPRIIPPGATLGKSNSNWDQAGPVGNALPVGPVRRDSTTQRFDPYGTAATAQMSMGNVQGMGNVVAPTSMGGMGSFASTSTRCTGVGDLL